MTSQPSSPTETRLESWKEIAAYLNRDARTVRRWEQSEGLPVHRHRHLARSSVYAYPSELDAWRLNRKPEPRATDSGESSRGRRAVAMAAVILFAVMSSGSPIWPLPSGVAATAQVNRQVWASPPEAPDSVTHDGRRISYSDASTGDVVIRDLVSGVEQRYSGILPGEAGGQVYSSLLSPDGARVIVQWQRPNPQHASIRLIDLRSKSAPKVLYDNPEASWVTPVAWSPDGRTVVLQVQLHGVGQLALLTPSDEKITVLKTTVWTGSSGIFFSPDSRRLVYDLPVRDGSPARDVFVIDIDGSREVNVVAHPASDLAAGWTSDGSEVVFASDRSGRTALYAAPPEGPPGHSPRLIKPDVGRLRKSFGVLRNGSLMYVTQVAARTVKTAAVDFETGRLLAPVSSPVETYLWASREPDWSRDGRSLAFLLEQPESATVIGVHDTATGTLRKFVTGLQGAMGPVWAGNDAIMVLGRDGQARHGHFRIDLATSQPTLAFSPGVLTGRTFFLSPDLKTLYYQSRAEGKPSSIHAVELSTRADREVAIAGSFALSPDGRSLAFIEHDRAAGTAQLKVVQIEGGASRTVTQFDKGHRLVAFVRWTADGRRLVYGRWIDQRDQPTAFSVSIQGGVPVELDREIPGHPSLAIHPDGRRVAFEAGGSAYEVWALDNFNRR